MAAPEPTNAPEPARRLRATRAQLDEANQLAETALAVADEAEDDALRLAFALARAGRLWLDPDAHPAEARLAALRPLAQYDETDPNACGLRCDDCGGPLVWRSGGGLPTCACSHWTNRARDNQATVTG